MVNYKKRFRECLKSGDFEYMDRSMDTYTDWDALEEFIKEEKNETLDELLKKSSGGNWRRVAEQMKTK
jgi:microsomal dipeptidase-like Zn-dependent dipeptidase